MHTRKRRYRAVFHVVYDRIVIIWIIIIIIIRGKSLRVFLLQKYVG